MAANAGFNEDQYDEIFIILDKMDKIGLDGVKENLLEEGFAAGSVEKYVSFFRLLEEGTDMKEFILLTCGTDAAQGMSDDLSSIMEAVSGMLDASVTLKFDPTLVRGMSYYTGTIFEITIDNYSFSIAGGGRYDRMVGRFCGQDAPACGFSIGFERIVTILRDLNWKMPQEAEKAAYLVDMKSAGGRVKEVFEKATRLREAGMIVTVQPLRKNAKFQVDMLESAGYGKIEKVYADTVL
jgi:histidyl-tRNA synthetase